MTQKALAQIRELDAAAEKAGGYVADPRTVKPNPKGERDFAAARSYSRQHGIPMHKLTDNDYKKIGIVRHL